MLELGEYLFTTLKRSPWGNEEKIDQLYERPFSSGKEHRLKQY